MLRRRRKSHFVSVLTFARWCQIKLAHIMSQLKSTRVCQSPRCFVSAKGKHYDYKIHYYFLKREVWWIGAAIWRISHAAAFSLSLRAGDVLRFAPVHFEGWYKGVETCIHDVRLFSYLLNFETQVCDVDRKSPTVSGAFFNALRPFILKKFRVWCFRLILWSIDLAS